MSRDVQYKTTRIHQDPPSNGWGQQALGCGTIHVAGRTHDDPCQCLAIPIYVPWLEPWWTPIVSGAVQDTSSEALGAKMSISAQPNLIAAYCSSLPWPFLWTGGWISWELSFVLDLTSTLWFLLGKRAVPSWHRALTVWFASLDKKIQKVEAQLSPCSRTTVDKCKSQRQRIKKKPDRQPWGSDPWDLHTWFGTQNQKLACTISTMWLDLIRHNQTWSTCQCGHTQNAVYQDFIFAFAEA